MARRPNPPISSPKGASAGYRLAVQMLAALRRRAAEKLKAQVRNQDNLDLLTAAAEFERRLPIDKASYAIRLAYCLAPHFATTKAIASTRALVLIRGSESDDLEAVGQVLGHALVADVGHVAINPNYHLQKEDRFVVMTHPGDRHRYGLIGAIAEAMEQCLPVFGIVPRSGDVPGLLAGADLDLDLPFLTFEMFNLLIATCHDGIPEDLPPFRLPEAVRTEDLVAHIRRGRPVAECLASLQHAVDLRAIKKPKTGPTVLLQDLAGYGEAKAWGLELAQDLTLWREGRLSWDEVDHRAVVLAGPPGTGKTTFASVLAGSLGVPLIATSVAEWNARDNLSGTLKRMETVFGETISKAPCVLFIDELDGISDRSKVESRYAEYWSQIVNRLLELVTLAQGTEGVVIVGATNHVERIDPALLRSGRLDQIIRIGVPDAEAIAAILGRYAGAALLGDDVQRLAKRLVGKTGADIEKLVRVAKASARRAGRTFSIFDLEALLVDPFDGLPPRTRRRIAIYRAGQRIVAQVLGLAEMATEQHDWDLRRLLAKGLSEERFPTEQICNDVLAIIMGGRAAEEIVFGEVSVYGCGTDKSDLAIATSIAADLELKSGFGETGLIYLGISDQMPVLPTAAVAGIRRRIESALARASALLLENREELEGLDRTGSGNRAGAHLRLLN